MVRSTDKSWSSKSKSDVGSSLRVMPNVATAELMLRLYYTSADQGDHGQSETMKTAFVWLMNNKMIDDKGPTERGRYWVDTVAKIPLPISVEVYQIPGVDFDYSKL